MAPLEHQRRARYSNDGGADEMPPAKKGRASQAASPQGRAERDSRARLVTPAADARPSSRDNDDPSPLPLRRQLFTDKEPSPQVEHDVETPTAKKRLAFGHPHVQVQPAVQQVYQTVRRLTGALGGNGCHGPIYGELTIGSMQKVVNILKDQCELTWSSRFMDVGSGIGKPNLHVAQDPGVTLSYGIEVSHERWVLSVTCLDALIKAAAADQHALLRGDNCVFACADIRQAQTFDPFTHVYMFSTGFPPQLWVALSKIWNRSSNGAQYLICFHGPRTIMDEYAFNVDLHVRTKTSLKMHGNKESHTCYFYKRKAPPSATQLPGTTGGEGRACDALFAPSVQLVTSGDVRAMQAHVVTTLAATLSSPTTTRSSSRGRSEHLMTRIQSPNK